MPVATNASILVAAVDGPSQDKLTCVKVFTWDRTFSIPGPNEPKAPAFLKHAGLTRYPDRWVDISERSDIQAGEPFPFQAKSPAPSPQGS